LKTEALCGFEALVRWRHPTRGIVAPMEFIPIAEDSGLIVPLGSWVLTQACKDAATWPLGLQVSVNVSAAQFERPDFLATVQEALRSSGLDAQRLELEITETTLMQDSDAAQRLLRALRGIGVRIALDDFGTGFSSLAYLLSFPLDKLKIDQSFVRQLETGKTNGKASAVVSTITQLAHVLGLETTAEGIETPEQLEILRGISCSFGQGYLYARPMDARSATVFMEHWAKVSVVAQVPHQPPKEWNKTVDSAYARIATRQVPLSAQSKWASL
jgi:EAL domain-containing protein (putative c-di-GMP-specific phosphodiesterase class I)